MMNQDGSENAVTRMMVDGFCGGAAASQRLREEQPNAYRALGRALDDILWDVIHKLGKEK